MPIRSSAVLAAVAIATLPTLAQAQGMNFSVYADASPSSDLAYLYVSSSTIDGSWGCSHSNYFSTVSVYSPSNRSSSSSAGGLTASTSIPIAAEFGNYTIATSGTYQCSCIFGGTAGFGGGQTVPVRRPADLRSVPPDNFTYWSLGNYLLTRIWQVYDDQGQTWTRSGTSVSESFQTVTNGCNLTIEPASEPVATNNQGRFNDKYGSLTDNPNAIPGCLPPYNGTCTSSFTQTISVGGVAFPHQVTYGCTSVSISRP